MKYKFITNPAQIPSTGYWYVAFGDYPIENESDWLRLDGRINGKYIIEQRVFKKLGNANNYVDRVKKKHWQNHFKVADNQIN